MNANECLRKLYVKLHYVPPSYPEKPVNCKLVKFSKPPEIKILNDENLGSESQKSEYPTGIDFHCLLPFVEGVGGVHLILQIRTFIEWELEFAAESKEPQICLPSAPQSRMPSPFENVSLRSEMKTSSVANGRSMVSPGRIVRETHRVYVSIPVAYTLTGPDIFIARLFPQRVNFARYAVKIWAAFKKLNEVDAIMAILASLKDGFCPNDISALEKSLKLLEIKLNYDLRHNNNASKGEMAGRTGNIPNGTGWFVGNRHV